MKEIIGSQTDVARQIIESLRRLESLYALSIPPSEGPPVEVYGQQVEDWQRLNFMAICASLPAAPVNCIQVPIFPVETLLIRNESDPYVPVTIVNEDLAQWIWVGPRGVLQTAGDIIIPLDKEHYVLGKGQELYARCAFATTNVSVVQGANLYANFISGGG